MAKVLSDAPAAGHNLIRKISKDLATAFCFKAFHLSASACQHGGTHQLWEPLTLPTDQVQSL